MSPIPVVTDLNVDVLKAYQEGTNMPPEFLDSKLQVNFNDRENSQVWE